MSPLGWLIYPWLLVRILANSVLVFICRLQTQALSEGEIVCHRDAKRYGEPAQHVDADIDLALLQAKNEAAVYGGGGGKPLL